MSARRSIGITLIFISKENIFNINKMKVQRSCQCFSQRALPCAVQSAHNNSDSHKSVLPFKSYSVIFCRCVHIFIYEESRADSDLFIILIPRRLRTSSLFAVSVPPAASVTIAPASLQMISSPAVSHSFVYPAKR